MKKPIADPNTPIGVADGQGGIISFCCSEDRHVECNGTTEVMLLPSVDVKCECMCHVWDDLN